MTSTSSAAIPVVVVGAGPYGLSVAAHLLGRGIPVRVFGEPMDSWRTHMPAGMILKSVPDASSLSAPVPGYRLADYYRLVGLPATRADQPVPGDVFLRYGMWFQEQLVPDVERVSVIRLGPGPHGFRLVLDSGEEVDARSVVMATGLTGYSYVPPELAAIRDSVSHSWEHSDLGKFADSEVAVLGGGQSALEGAVLLREAGARVRVVVRREVAFDTPPHFVDGREPSSLAHPWTPMGRGWSMYALHRFPVQFRSLPDQVRLRVLKNALGPSGSWWLRDRFGSLPSHPRSRLVGARYDHGRPVLDTVDEHGVTVPIAADHVLAATGYRVDVDQLGFIEPATRAALTRVAGSPRLSSRFESSVPNLYFVGLAAAATFGSLLRFVCGTAFAAHRLSETIANRAGRAAA
jgi:hypothetical protein